ncbi:MULTISPECIES: hypothetical protein [Yersinia]|uniref:Uncharacterized protein n=1 Tax=Yersinia frederiksenii TaxID=29484 RepID=A0AAI9ELM6_YERFR|nr:MULTISPECIES: hypothetical protein [Yersinia]MDN0126865.1 hypothetical protein [Yersinia massiliensis]CFQ87989.1 Uncharacterised protein [Yersinia frederiksenii]
MSEVARYKVLRRSYINFQILEEGEEVDYEGKPGSALEPINEAAKLAKAGAVVIADVVPVVDERDEAPLIDPPTPVVALTEQGVTVDSEAALQLLREEYEGLFGKKPHPATQEETLKTKIAEKRKELGFV